MTKKPHLLAGKPLEGSLAEPIDFWQFGLILGVHSQDEIDAYQANKSRQLFDIRRAKIPDLARHLGFDPDNDGFRGAGGREFLLELTLMVLARETVIGFQEKKEGKWPRARVFWALQAIDALKNKGTFKNDLAACESLLKIERPELAKRNARAELKAEAIQYRTRITHLREKLKKAQELEARSLHKKPRLRIVK